MNEGARGLTNLPNSQVKSHLIDPGWLVEAAQLAHELKRGCPDLFVCCRGLKVKERLDVPAHDHLQNLTFNYHVVEHGLAKSTSLLAPSDLFESPPRSGFDRGSSKARGWRRRRRHC